METEVTKIELYNDLNLRRGMVYHLIATDYKESDVRLRTGSFDTSIIHGEFNVVETKLNICSIVFKDFIFRNCIIKNGSWLDSSEFINCQFIDCVIKGDMRWLQFDRCNFENVVIDQSYSRASTIKKNCTKKNVTFKTKQIDGYVWLFGKRYSDIPSKGLKFK